MTKDEALKELFDSINGDCCVGQDRERELVSIIKKALEQPAQVTRLEVIDNNGRSYVNYGVDKLQFSYQDDGRTLKLFTNGAGIEQPAWQGLSDDDLTEICEKYWDSENGHSIKDIILIVQQALKDKNT